MFHAICHSPVCITIPERTRRVGGVEAERVAVFSEAIDVRLTRELGLEPKVLGLEDESSCRRVEEDLAGRPSGDLERERRRRVRELDVRRGFIDGGADCRPRKDGARDLIPNAVGVGYFDMYPVSYKENK